MYLPVLQAWKVGIALGLSVQDYLKRYWYVVLSTVIPLALTLLKSGWITRHFFNYVITISVLTLL